MLKADKKENAEFRKMKHTVRQDKTIKVNEKRAIVASSFLDREKLEIL